MNPPLFSIVIPSRNNRDRLRTTLGSIAQSDFDLQQVEVIVVDDGSTDGTYEEFQNATFPYRFTILRRSFGGQSAATNEAIRHATGTYILSLASDIIVHPSLLQEHLSWHRRFGEEDVVVLGSLPYAPQLHVSPFMFYLVTGGWQFAYYLIKDPLNVPPQFLYAPNFSARRSTLLAVGLFDEAFEFGSQDTDLGIRLLKHGARIVYNKNAIGYHNHPIRFEQFFRRQEMAGASLVRLTEKHPDFEDRVAMWDHVVTSYAGFSSLEYDRSLALVERATKLVERADLDYQEVWRKVFLLRTPVNALNAREQAVYTNVNTLFVSYHRILSFYWAKGFLEEAIKVLSKEVVSRCLAERLLRYQLSNQVKRCMQRRFAQVGIELPYRLRCNTLASIVVCDVDSYAAALDYLSQFQSPPDAYCNYQLVLVVKREVLREEECRKLEEIADLVEADGLNAGVFKALQRCEGTLICLTSMRVKLQFNEVISVAEECFRKLDRVGILGGNVVDSRSGSVRFGYRVNGSIQPAMVTQEQRHRLKIQEIDAAIPECFLLQQSIVESLLAQPHIANGNPPWFLQLSSAAKQQGKRIYHVPQLAGSYVSLQERAG